MIKNSVTICGLNCNVAHITRIQTDYPFPPAKLRDEIAKRAGHPKHNYRSKYVHVSQHDFEQTVYGVCKQTYDITFAYEEVLDDILSIVQEIEADVAKRLEDQRILSLLDEEDK